MAVNPLDCVVQAIQLARSINELRELAVANEVYAMTTLDRDIRKIRIIMGKIQSVGQAPLYIADALKDLVGTLKEAEALIKKTVARSAPKKALQAFNRIWSADKRKAELEQCEKRVRQELDFLTKCLDVDMWVELSHRRRGGEEPSRNQSLVDLPPLSPAKAEYTSLCVNAPVKLAAGLSRNVGPLRHGRAGMIVNIENGRYEVCAKYEQSIFDWFSEEELVLLEQDPFPPLVKMLDVVVVADEYDDAPNVKQGPLGTMPDQAGIVLSHDAMLGGQLQVAHISSGTQHCYDAAHLRVLDGDERDLVIQRAARQNAGMVPQFLPGDIVMLTEDRAEIEDEALEGPLTALYSIGIVEPLSRDERRIRNILNTQAVVKVRARAGMEEYLYEEHNLQIVLKGNSHTSSVPMMYGVAIANPNNIPKYVPPR